MQLKVKDIMQDEECDANADDDNSKASSGSKLVMIDCGDIIPRYCDISPLGCGSNALVFSAIDQNSQRRVAVKKVTLKPTTSLTALKRLFREIRVLRQLDHENVVKIHHTLVSTRRKNSGSPLNVPGSAQQDNLLHSTPLSVDAMYIGMEMMDADLNSVLLQQRLAPCYIKLFLYQLLRGVKYIHSANVIHRDLTPSNIFINVDTLMLKIGDFGVCRIFDDEYDHCGHLSMASASTHYQAPELILRPKHYSKAIDVWAVGCVFAAMIGGKPFFNGDSSLDQIGLILSSVAVTSMNWDSVVSGGCTDRRCCPDPAMYETRENGGHPDFPLRDALPQASLMAINLLQQLLTFDPRDRITAADALMHRYLSPYTQSSDEPVCLQPFYLEDELDDDVTPASCQRYLLSEAGKFASFDSNYVETSNEDALSSRRGSRTSMSIQGSSCKNLVSLVQSANSLSSTQSGLITESEARTIACDFDYGVQITDGSVKRERILDFQPIQATTDCFDPYKWDHHDNNDKESDVSPEADVTTDERRDDPIHSDHGYSSYCSSNISHGRTHPHSMWSLSSPDLSVDMGASHRASAPEMGELWALSTTEPDGHHSDTRPSPTMTSEDKPPSESRRRHKDDAPRHHSYHHHHHHHHHHHKHHRHSGRHGNSSTPQLPLPNHEGDSLASSNGRRHCVVTEIVLEEEGITVEVAPQDPAPDKKELVPSLRADDLSKPKAPSEHLLEAVSSFNPKPLTFALVPDEEQSNVNRASRSRARSDGSQCRRPGLVPINQNLLQQFHPIDQVAPEQKNGFIKSSLMAPLCVPSLTQAQLGGSLSSLTRYLPWSRPQKCASSDPKPAVHPFKQVECPF